MKTACFAALSLVVSAGGVAASDVKTFLYDAQGRLTAVTRVTTVPESYAAYTFDDADNRTQRNVTVIPPQAAPNILYPGEALVPNASLRSVDGRSSLVLQGDGNLVLYFGSTPLWATSTGTGQSMVLTMQGDGNLVLYNPSMGALWASGTSGNPGAAVVLQDDCNLVIYGGAGAIWASNTNC